MKRLGYTSSYEVLDTRDFGIPQRRERVFTISILGRESFDFSKLEHKPMRNIKEFLQADEELPDNRYDIVSPSMTSRIDPNNFDNAPVDKLSVIKNYAMTICCNQDRCPNAGIILRPNGRYRLLTELECWRLQGYSDDDFYNALKANPTRSGYKNQVLYKQAGNSISVTIFESIFKAILL